MNFGSHHGLCSWILSRISNAVLVELRLREPHQLIDQHLRTSPVISTSSRVPTAWLTGTRVECAAQATAKRGTQLVAVARAQRPIQRRAQIAAHAHGVRVVVEPCAQAFREIAAIEPPLYRFADEKVIADEARQGAADVVLARRNDARVRDWQAERPAEQRHDCEPVGEATDQRGFGERARGARPAGPAAATRSLRRTRPP